MMTKFLRTIVIASLLFVSLQSSAPALTNEELFSQFQFNFITPGARATALGGAFIGLADDATAVESNPAGLTILTVPEISAESKYIIYTAEQVYENHNPETNINKEEFDDTVRSLPFISWVYPYKPFVFSLYRQELVNYRSSFRTGCCSIAIPGIYGTYLAPIDALVELTVTNYGVGVALQLFEGFSLAVSPRWSELKIRAYSSRFDAPTNFSSDDLMDKSEIDNGNSTFSITSGILWKPHPKFSIGAVYKSGPKFTVPQNQSVPNIVEFTLNIPDSYGAGVAFRATDFLTMTLDVLHIRYQDLLDDFNIVAHGAFTNNYTVDNATEFHLGIEYILPLGQRFLALRAGVYHEPDHTIRFTGTTGNYTTDGFGKALFPGGEDQIHITGGAGLVLHDRFQVDTAVNVADKMKQLSISAIYRF